MTATAIAQKILDGKWRHASAALRACQRGEWASFAREVAPPTPMLVGRLDHGRRWTAATVVESRSYAPDIRLLLRAGSFAALELQINEVLSVDARETEPLLRPTREVPMFASWFEPRVRVSPELETQIRAMCFTAEDEADGP